MVRGLVEERGASAWKKKISRTMIEEEFSASSGKAKQQGKERQGRGGKGVFWVSSRRPWTCSGWGVETRTRTSTSSRYYCEVWARSESERRREKRERERDVSGKKFSEIYAEGGVVADVSERKKGRKGERERLGTEVGCAVWTMLYCAVLCGTVLYCAVYAYTQHRSIGLSRLVSV